MTSDLETLTTKYFKTHDPEQWGLRSYHDYITQLYPGIQLSESNSRCCTALRKIATSASAPTEHITKAEFLIDQVKQRSNKRKRDREERRQTHGFVNNGRVTIAHGGTVIEHQQVCTDQHITGTASGKGTKKRRRVSPRRTSTPTPSEFSEDEEDQYEDEEGGEEEEEEEDREENSIPRGKDDGLNNSDTDARPITTHTNTSTPAGSHRLDTFLNSFTGMQEADKRTFTCSGRVLENVIHAAVATHPVTAGDALDWVIDLKVDNVRRWFSEPELKELRSWLPPTPKVDQYFTYARQRYDKKSSIIDLRETSESKPTPPQTPYDRKVTFNATYVNAAVTSLLSTIEQSATNESFGCPQSHREGWYGSKIWSMLLDHCLDDLDNFTVSRTDIASKVGCPGRRFDAMFLAGGVGVDLAEVGAVEVARSGDVLGAGKRQEDQGKLRKLMKAMVKALWKMSGCDDDAGRKLQVVGVQHVGFHIRISTMCAVSRGVFILQPGTWRTVPHKLANFETVFDVLQAVVVMKAIVRRTVKVLRAHANVKAEVDDDFEL